ncbi:MAG: ATP-binding protein [Actinobacteria bacterium]|nr:ATP-binding protein [Actinomycetota bacterium]
MCLLKRKNYHIKLDSKPENLTIIRNFFKGIASKHNINESDTYNILVSIGEATTNAIEHGNGGPIEIVCKVIQDTFHVIIKSKGTFSKKVQFTEEDNFRGRGILLMLALMDRVNIDGAKDGIIVTMSKKFKQAS